MKNKLKDFKVHKWIQNIKKKTIFNSICIWIYSKLYYYFFELTVPNLM